MRCLVTGGAGLIGSAVCAQLRGQGADVEVWDVAGKLAVDVSAAPLIERPFDMVFHLAANTDNRLAEFTGALSSLSALCGLLDALRRVPPRVIVYSSSQLVYGAGAGLSEMAPMLPGSSFASGKHAGEALLAGFGREAGVPTVACRLCNVIGTGVRRGIVSDLVERARSSSDGSLRILGDGTQIRSYLLAEDCAAAIIAAAESPRWESVNVANLDSISARRVAELVTSVTNRDLTVVPEVSSVGWATDPGSLTMDTSRIQALGWVPAADSSQAVHETAQGLWSSG